jgi:lipoprotein-anchoring transpeptidase ErfK/SrfK
VAEMLHRVVPVDPRSRPHVIAIAFRAESLLAALDTSSSLCDVRFLLLLVCLPLAACNAVLSPPPHPYVTSDVVGSYAGYQSAPLQDTPISHPDRPLELQPETVRYTGRELPGTIVINTRERRLYLVVDGEVAIRYAVGVGKAGRQWQGRAVIDGAHIEPAWAPTPEIKRDNPSLPDVIPGGSPGNPMGARALTLSGGEYAIHGTNRPESIGTYASYGCIRMFNEDIVDLFSRVRVGTEVVVTL